MRVPQGPCKKTGRADPPRPVFPRHSFIHGHPTSRPAAIHGQSLVATAAEPLRPARGNLGMPGFPEPRPRENSTTAPRPSHVVRNLAGVTFLASHGLAVL